MVTVSQPRVSQSVARVFFDRFLKVLDGFLYAIRCAFVPVVATLQIQLISLSILCEVSGQPFLLLTLQPQAQLVGDLTGDIFLYGQDVGELAVVLLAPQFGAVPDVHQVHADGQGFAALRDSPRQNRADIEVASNFLRVNIAAFIAEDGTPRHDLQPRYLR